MKYLFCLMTAALALASCKKDSNSNNSGPSKTDLITSATWKYNSGGIDQDRNGTVDLTFESTGLVQPCVLDNTATFRSDGSGTGDEGATKCSTNAPQTTPFTWSFGSGETTLNINGSLLGIGGTFKVTSLTSTALSLSKDTSMTISGINFNVSIIANLKH